MAKGSNVPDRAAEIEVTQEMVEAGVLPLLRYHPDRNSEDDIVKEIFCAMMKASRSREQRGQ